MGANHFRTYHTVLKTSEDYYSAMTEARIIAANISSMLSTDTVKVDVYPYSVFYVFYEQYLTMWRDVLTSLALSAAGVFLVTFILLGLDIQSALIILVTIFMIIADVFGLMYWWNISLNAVSLINLVMVGPL